MEKLAGILLSIVGCLLYTQLVIRQKLTKPNEDQLQEFDLHWVGMYTWSSKFRFGEGVIPRLVNSWWSVVASIWLYVRTVPLNAQIDVAVLCTIVSTAITVAEFLFKV